MSIPVVPTPDPPTSQPLSVGGGPLGRIRYARAYFRSMNAPERRERLEFWMLKPDLGGRLRRFIFPPTSPKPNTGRARRLRRRAEVSYRSVDSWTQAMDGNLSAVEQVLQRAEIRYAVIDDQSPRRRQVGVAAADKQRVIAAFRRYSQPDGFLAGAPWTRDVRLTSQPRSRLSDHLLQRRLEMSTSFIWSTPMRIGTRGYVLGLAFGTVISFWAPSTDQDGVRKVYSSAPNRWSPVLPIDADSEADIAAEVSRALTGKTAIDDIDFPIDLVCLWVDGSDPEWSQRRNERLTAGTGGLSADATQPHLFRDREELRYALRSIREFAPFINHVYLVTDRQRPDWLDAEADGLTVVDHRDIFPADALPVFNSNAIDTRLHHIDGLSEHFLVTNDDIMFLGPTMATDFFTPSGQTKAFLSKAQIPIGPPVAGEPGVDSAAKMNRSLIEQRLGVTISQKFKHIMIPQRRSIRERVEAAYATEVDATSRHPFRDMNDVAFSHLCIYDSLRTGGAVVANLAYDYVSLGDPAFDQRLSRLEERPGSIKVLCLNDGDSSTVSDVHGRPVARLQVDPVSRDARLAQFLETVYPTPSKWELTHDDNSTLVTNSEDPT